MVEEIVAKMKKKDRGEKKVIRFSDTLFSKNRSMRVAFDFYFHFPVGYILGHLGLLG